MANRFEPRGFAVDHDGIIIDTERRLVDINTELLSQYNVKFDPSLRKYFTGKPNIAGLKGLIKVHGLEGKVTAEELAHIRNPMLEDWYKNPHFVDGYLDLHRAMKSLFPQAPLVIVSGTDPWVFDLSNGKLDYAKEFHDVCLTKACVTNHKPAPDAFVYGLALAQCPVYAGVTLEDSPLGLAGSINAGIPKNIAYTGTLNREDLKEALEEQLGRDVREGEEVFFIDDYSQNSIQEVVDYIRKPIQ